MNDLLQDVEKVDVETSSQINTAQTAFQPELDPRLRPWHGLDFDSNTSEKIQDWRQRPELESFVEPPPEIWYSSARGIVRALIANRFALLLTLIASMVGCACLASLIPSSYFSTLHLYAPEKTDSISSRLQMFSNKLEFASFPVDFHIPLGLIARRLKSEPAKAWVLKHYAEMPVHAGHAKIDPDLISAETFYAEGSELLVIQSYANDPDIAVDTTNLYWDYLENEIKSLHEENLNKVHKWIELTSVDLNQKLDGLSKQLSGMPSSSSQAQNDQLKTQLASDLSNAQMKRQRLEKEQSKLKQALDTNDLDTLLTLPDPELQDLRRVDEALRTEYGSQEKNHAELLRRAIEIVQRHLYEKSVELSAIVDQLSQFHQQLSERASASRTDSSVVAKQTDLLRQQTDYEGRLEDLEKLKNQIDVESTLTHTKLRPIQAAFADPSTRRPSMILKYTVSVLIAVLLTILMLVFLESQFMFKIRMAIR